LYELDLYIKGPYNNKFEILEEPDFVYYPGILLHEEHHFLMKKRFIPQRLDSITFPLIRKLSLNKTEYPCPENTSSRHQIIISHLRAGIKVGGDLSLAYDDEIDLRGTKPIRMKKDNEYVVINVPVSELEADKHASDFYRNVKDKIITWWENRNN
jgi:hypothetical protein